MNKKNKNLKLNKKELKSVVLSALQKIILVFLAVLMVICVIPFGFFKSVNRVDRRGELIRVLPSGTNATAFSSDHKSMGLSDKDSVIMTFDLSKVENLDLKDVSSVRLRLSFINGTGSKSNKISVTVPDDNNNYENAVKLSKLYKNKLYRNIISNYRQCGNVYPDSFKSGNSVCTVDITKYALESFKTKSQKLVTGIWGENEKSVYLATDNFSDPYCRPYLEIVTKKTDSVTPDTSFKTTLTDAVYVSSDTPDSNGSELSGQKGGLQCGTTQTRTDYSATVPKNNVSEAYLKFNINRSITEGSIYSARLSLKTDIKSNISNRNSIPKTVTISCLNGQSWQSDTITYNNRPTNGQTTLSVTAAATSDCITADVTQCIADAYKRGFSDVTFRITSADNIFIFGSGSGLNTPALYINSTDESDIVCASNAALNALSKNGESYVTTNLLNTYSYSNSTASITWQALNTDKNRQNIKYLSSKGEVSRPKWFEGDIKLTAKAKISCGSFNTTRLFPITIRAEAPPDYSKYTFDNYTKIGDNKSEESQKFNSVNLGQPRRMSVSGKSTPYRQLYDGSCMLLNMKTSPSGTNYLTLKLSCNTNDYNTNSSLSFLIAPWDYNGEPVLAETVNFNAFNAKAIYNGGSKDNTKAETNQKNTYSTNNKNQNFIYYTIPLPENFTKGNTSANLRVIARINKGEDIFKTTNTTNYDYRIFGAYITQNPCFDPKQFVKQGEVISTERISTNTSKTPETSGTSENSDTYRLQNGFLKNAAVFLEDYDLYTTLTNQPKNDTSKSDLPGSVISDIKAYFNKSENINNIGDTSNISDATTEDNTKYEISDSHNLEGYVGNIITKNRKGIIFNDASSKIAFMLHIDGNKDFDLLSSDKTRLKANVYEDYTYYDRISRDLKVSEVKTTTVDGNNQEATLLSAEYGDYLMLYNIDNIAGDNIFADVPDGYEKDGVYKNITNGGYYYVSEFDTDTDYTEKLKEYKAILPKEAEIYPLTRLTVQSDSAILLKRLSAENRDGKWRITAINDIPSSEFDVTEPTLLNTVTVRSADSIPDDTDILTLVCGIYKDGKLLNLKRLNTTLVQSMDIYTFDLSKYKLEIRQDCTFKIFAYDNTANLLDLKPALEYPK